MKTISNKEFLQKIKNSKGPILVIGKVGLERLASVKEFKESKKEVK